MFKNREEAGRQLAERLKDLRKENSLVLAIPRGGVIVGKMLAQGLGCPLGVVLVRKIGAPGNPELAVGAVGPDEVIVWNREILSQLRLREEDLRREIKKEQLKIKDYCLTFEVKKLGLKDKTVILTDDGLATGATAEAAITWIKRQKPAQIILAAPVAVPEVVEKLRNLVDELIVLKTPAFFSAVGQFYQEFPQIEDEEVVAILNIK